MVPGLGTTLKYFVKKGGKIFLEAANPAYEPIELKLEEVKLLENELSNFNSKVGFEKKIDFVVNAFSKTVDYPREVLMNSKLVIPFVGMHEALIVNDNTLNGYLYDKVSKNDESLLENKFDSIIDLIENKFKEEKFNELFSKLLNEKSNFLKDEETKKMIDELENCLLYTSPSPRD